MNKKKYLIRAFSKENRIIYMGVINLGLNSEGVPTHIMDVDVFKWIKEFASEHRHNLRDLSVEEFLDVMGYDNIEISTL